MRVWTAEPQHAEASDNESNLQTESQQQNTFVVFTDGECVRCTESHQQVCNYKVPLGTNHIGTFAPLLR
jgi:hypothetical protein